MKLTTIVGTALLVGSGYVAAVDDPDQTTAMQSTDAQSSIIDNTGNSSASSSASTSSSMGTRDFNALDSNGDGYLSRSESPQTNSDFDTADRNGDGRIDQNEWTTAQRSQSAESSMNSDEPHSQIGSADAQTQRHDTSRMQ
jgi:Ca2+-binding EF-hand superfamily protein